MRMTLEQGVFTADQAIRLTQITRGGSSITGCRPT